MASKRKSVPAVVLDDGAWGRIAVFLGEQELKKYNLARDQVKGILRSHIYESLRALVSEEEVELMFDAIVSDVNFAYWTREMANKFLQLHRLYQAYEAAPVFDTFYDDIPWDL